MKQHWHALRHELWPVVMPGLVIAMALAISINFWLLIPALQNLKEQSANGQKARTVQCAREPVNRKLAAAAYAVRRDLPAEARITRAELDHWKAASPRGCPK